MTILSSVSIYAIEFAIFVHLEKQKNAAPVLGQWEVDFTKQSSNEISISTLVLTCPVSYR